jgi:hypothetical protein
MELRVLLVVGVVAAAALTGASGPATAQSDEEMVTLTVEVVLSSNERLGDVTLVAEWDGGESTATTASNGMAFIDVPRGANVDITVESDEYIRNRPYNIRTATEKEHTIEIARKAELDVVVSDAEGPIADAEVVLRQDGFAATTGRTDANGRFQSGTIEQGQYTVEVVKSGYYRTTENVIVAGSPERSVRIERGRVDYDIVVEDPYFDPARPVPNATVSIERIGDLTTNDRGTVASLVPVNSRLRIEVSKDGYETTTETITVDETAGSASVSLGREPSLSLSTLNERVVVGEVVGVEVTNAYGEPAAGVELFLDGERVAETDGNGEARVRISEPGDHELQARRGETSSTAVTVRGVGEGEGETDAEAQETDTATPTTGTETPMSGGSGSGLGGLLGPLLALVVVVALVALVVVYRRRSRNRGDSWTDGTAGTAGETVDFDTRDGGDGPGVADDSTEPSEQAGSDTSDEPSEQAGSDTSDEPSEQTGSDTPDEPSEKTGSDTPDEPSESDTADRTDQSAGDEADEDGRT